MIGRTDNNLNYYILKKLEKEERYVINSFRIA